MGKLDEIYEGWKNLTFENEEVEAIAKKRMEICVGCENLRTINVCRICSCFMPAKVRSLKSSCDLKKW